MPPANSPQTDPTDKFRDIVAAAAELVRVLEPNCPKTSDLAGVLELASANDGQLSLLMDKMDPKARR